MPVRAPVVPSPTKAAKIADSKAEAKRDSRAVKEQSWIRIPTWPNPDGLSIRKPGIILRHVNNLRVCRFDHNGLPLIAHVFLMMCSLSSRLSAHDHASPEQRSLLPAVG